MLPKLCFTPNIEACATGKAIKTNIKAANSTNIDVGKYLQTIYTFLSVSLARTPFAPYPTF